MWTKRAVAIGDYLQASAGGAVKKWKDFRRCSQERRAPQSRAGTLSQPDAAPGRWRIAELLSSAQIATRSTSSRRRAGFRGIEYRRLPRFHDVSRPADVMRRVDLHDLSVDK